VAADPPTSAVQAHEFAAIFEEHEQVGIPGGTEPLQVAASFQAGARPSPGGSGLYERGHPDHPAIIVETDQGAVFRQVHGAQVIADTADGMRGVPVPGGEIGGV
jgi:hypothetical protein